MTVTQQLLRLFRVDQQIRGLQVRLNAAQRFLDTQEKHVAEIEAKRAAVQAQLRQLTATRVNVEGEAAAIQAKVDRLKEQMNAARTNKEYQAFLVEVNTLKVDKGKLEDEVLAALSKEEELKKQADAFDAALQERASVRKVAATDRDQRAEEIKDRLNELQSQRAAIVANVPPDALKAYRERDAKFGDTEDGVMAAIELHDARRHEFTCGACQTHLPVQILNALLKGSLTRCVSCGVILFIHDSDAERLAARQK